MNEIIYSIIIPHKNCPQLLQRCLDSIPHREDTQIIVVDDNSDQDKVDFKNFPGLTRPNTEVYFEKVGKGAGYSRNVGMLHAKGKWLMFADADDTFTDCLNDILDKYKNDDHHDMVILNAQRVNEFGEVKSNFSLNRYIANYRRNRIYSEKVVRYGFWTPWSRMVKRKMVEDNSIRYEEIPVGNDMMFCLNCSKFSKYLAVEEHPVYRYVHPDGRSLTASYRRTEEAQRELFKLFLRAEDLCKTVGYIFRPTPLAVYYKAFFRRDENNKKMWRIFKESMKLNRCSYLKESFFLLVLFIGKLLKVI